MNLKNKYFLKSIPIILSSGVYFYSKFSTKSQNNRLDHYTNDNNKYFRFLGILHNLKQKIFSSNIMYCRKQEKNELDFISDQDLENTDNYLKTIEEKYFI